MKLVRIDYDDKEQFDQITVKMSRQEAAGLVNLLGKLNGHAQTKLDIDSEMYDCLSSVFNMHEEDGAPNYHINLETLNENPLS